MSDLKDDLAALHIPRELEPPRRGRGALWLGLLVLLAAAGFAGWRWTVRDRPIPVEIASVSARRRARRPPC